MEDFVGEKENFETLAARTVRNILEHLRAQVIQSEKRLAEPGAATETADASRGQQDDPRAGAMARPVFTIEIDQPEMAGASLFIPQADRSQVLDWGVMTEVEDPSRKGANLFSLSVILYGKVDDRNFVRLPCRQKKQKRSWRRLYKCC